MNNLDKITKIKEYIDNCDAILIGAGAGLSTSAGHSYSGERFYRNFSDFNKKYNITDMYSGGFYPFPSPEEYYAWWSRHIMINRYSQQNSKVHKELLNLVKDKNYFVITTNVDHLFQSNGFDKQRLFYTQGDYGLFQCSKACHQKTYDNQDLVIDMIKQQKEMKIPTDLIPYCPICKSLMVPNLRSDKYFVEDDGWHLASEKYNNFIRENQNTKIVYLEIGVGLNTPGIIKYPFIQMVYRNKNATYVCINLNKAYSIEEIENRSICIQDDIKNIIKTLNEINKETN